MASTSVEPLQNIYYERKVATDRPCYICKRPTIVVLATIDTKDFLYTCDSHLTDSGFATLISPPPAPSGPSQEDIKKVIADYKAREEKKTTKSDDKDKEKDKKDDKEKEKEVIKPASPIPSSTPVPAASHRKFALHRQIFEMRRDDIKRKEQGVKAREVGKGAKGDVLVPGRHLRSLLTPRANFHPRQYIECQMPSLTDTKGMEVADL